VDFLLISQSKLAFSFKTGVHVRFLKKKKDAYHSKRFNKVNPGRKNRQPGFRSTMNAYRNLSQLERDNTLCIGLW